MNVFNLYKTINRHHVEENDVQNLENQFSGDDDHVPDITMSDALPTIQPLTDEQSPSTPTMLQLSYQDFGKVGFGRVNEESEDESAVEMDWESFFLDTLAPDSPHLPGALNSNNEEPANEEIISDGLWRPFPAKEVCFLFFAFYLFISYGFLWLIMSMLFLYNFQSTLLQLL